MTIGAGILLIAVGAILYFATDLHLAQVSIDTVGLILMLAGLAGLLLGLFQEVAWARSERRRNNYVEGRREPSIFSPEEQARRAEAARAERAREQVRRSPGAE